MYRPQRRPSRAAGLGAVLSGLALCGSLPPFGWWPLAFVGLVGLDRLLADQPRRTRFARGALVGVGLYLPSLVWMQALTVPGYLIASFLYAGMLGVGAAAAPAGRGRWASMAGAWTLVELLRWSWPFGGVPLSNLAIGQVAGPLAGVARLGGALLLVTITVLAGQAVAAFVDGQRRAAAALAAVVIAVVAGASVAPDGRAAGSAEVAMVQGGGPQGTRKSNATVTATFARHVEATDEVRPPIDLILWPEDVIDTEEDFASDPWAGVISALAEGYGAPMIVGTVEGAGPTDFRNAAVLVDATGEIVDRYDKVHRVPFGEYVPFRSLLERFAEDALPDRDLIAGEGRARLDVPGPIGRASVAISWEVFFPDRAREGVGDGGRIIMNPTNGSSFSGTIVQTQQVASSRLRAIENGRWVLQVAPTGFSAVVDHHGEVLTRSSISEATVIQGVVQLREGETIYTRVGNAPALVLSFVLLALGWAIERRVSRG